jgi:hypothetical protein
MAHTKAIGFPGMPACCRVAMEGASDAPWLTGAMVKYYAGSWTVEERAAIEQELDRQGVQYSIDAENLLVHDDHAERMVDMIVESITET